MKNQLNFTEGSILPLLVRFTLPILGALCLQSMYGAVDLWVVGQFGTPADVSAVSIGGQIMQTVTNAITSLSIGVTILLGRKIGQEKQEEAGEVIGTGICVFALLALGITVLMQMIAQPFAQALQTPPAALKGVVVYVHICGGGAVCIVAYNVLGSIFRGLGDARTPLLTVLAACVCNIVGDLLFVGVFGLGVAGAALATVLAQAFSVMLCLWRLRKRKLPFPFSKATIRLQKQVASKIFALGLPVAMQDGLESMSFLAIDAIVNRLGVVPSAGIGVAGKLCGFIMLLPLAYMQSLSAFVAQNMGAGKSQRAVKAMGYGILTSFSVSLVLAYLAFFHGDLLAGLFVPDPAVISAAVEYLKAYAIDTMLVSFLFCFAGYFSGCEQTKFVLVQGIIGAFGVRIPISYLVSRVQPVSLFFVGLATPISTAVQITLCGIYFAMMRRRMQEGTKETIL